MRLGTWFSWPKFSQPPGKSFRQMSGFGVEQPLKLLFCGKAKDRSWPGADVGDRLLPTHSGLSTKWKADVRSRLAFDMSGGFGLAQPAQRRPLDGEVRRGSLSDAFGFQHCAC